MAQKIEARKYTVNITVHGSVQRVVRAKSEEEALSIAKALLLQADGQTPKDKMLDAFCWDVWHEDADLHWSQMTAEERDALVNKNLEILDVKDNTEPNLNPEQEKDNDKS